MQMNPLNLTLKKLNWGLNELSDMFLALLKQQERGYPTPYIGYFWTEEGPPHYVYEG